MRLLIFTASAILICLLVWLVVGFHQPRIQTSEILLSRIDPPTPLVPDLINRINNDECSGTDGVFRSPSFANKLKALFQCPSCRRQVVEVPTADAESFTIASHSGRLADLPGSVIIASPARCTLPLALRIKNETSHDIHPYVRPAPGLDLSSVSGLQKSILKPGMTPEEKSLALWNLLSQRIQHRQAVNLDQEDSDPIKALNVWGYNLCESRAINFNALAESAGLKARVMSLTRHDVAEVFYDDRWHMFDPHHGSVYRADDGHIASVEELAQHPSLLQKAPYDSTGWLSSFALEVYGSADDNQVKERDTTALRSHDTGIRLGPGDSVTYRVLQQPTAPLKVEANFAGPPVEGEGELLRHGINLQPASLPSTHSQVTFVEELGYPIVAATLHIKLTGISRCFAGAFSVDGSTWDNLDITWLEKYAVVDLTSLLRERPVYKFYLRFSALVTDTLPEAGRMTLISLFRFAPQSLPQMTNGREVIEIVERSPAGLGTDQRLSAHGGRKDGHIFVETKWAEL